MSAYSTAIIPTIADLGAVMIEQPPAFAGAKTIRFYRTPRGVFGIGCNSYHIDFVYDRADRALIDYAWALVDAHSRAYARGEIPPLP